MSEMHFESVLSDEFRSLIAMKRALGYKYETDYLLHNENVESCKPKM